MTTTRAFVTGLLTALAIGFPILVGVWPKPTPAPVTCPPEPPDAWIVRRIGYCDQACGAVPFLADVSETKTSCYCDRPAKLPAGPKPKKGKGP